MTSANYVEDLNQGRGWLNRAAEMLDACEDHRSDAEFARAAAAIGNGFVALAQAQMSAPVSLRLTSEMPPALISAVERAGRAEAEARPHQHVECTCEYAPAIGQLHRPNCPAYVAPVGEAAYLLEGDDEIFTEADRG